MDISVVVGDRCIGTRIWRCNRAGVNRGRGSDDWSGG